jgi:hypothetical protein
MTAPPAVSEHELAPNFTSRACSTLSGRSHAAPYVMIKAAGGSPCVRRGSDRRIRVGQVEDVHHDLQTLVAVEPDDLGDTRDSSSRAVRRDRHSVRHYSVGAAACRGSRPMSSCTRGCDAGHTDCLGFLQRRHLRSRGEGNMRTAHTLSIAFAVVLSATTYASPGADRGHEPADLTGTYSCRGQNFDGKPYEATVQVEKENDAYQLLWIANDEVVAVGMGVLRNDVLAVAYFSGSPGVVAYHLEGEGRLVGHWTVPDAGGIVASETLTRTSTGTRGWAPPSPPRSGDPDQEMPVRRPVAKTRPA